MHWHNFFDLLMVLIMTLCSCATPKEVEPPPIKPAKIALVLGA